MAIMDRLNAQQSDLIHAWSAEKTRESQRLSKKAELQAKSNQWMEELQNFNFQPFLQLSSEPSLMVSSLENSYSQITRVREIVRKLEEWPKTISEGDFNLPSTVVDQVAKGQVSTLSTMSN